MLNILLTSLSTEIHFDFFAESHVMPLPEQQYVYVNATPVVYNAALADQNGDRVG